MFRHAATQTWLRKDQTNGSGWEIVDDVDDVDGASSDDLYAPFVSALAATAAAKDDDDDSSETTKGPSSIVAVASF